MALPWSALFSAIPWTDVIAKAPDIAQGARKLWQKTAKRGADAAAPPTPAGPAAPSLETRLAALESLNAELALRQQQSAELLAALATQNADLVQAAEALRRRVRQLSMAVGALAGGLALTWLWLLSRSG